MAKLNISDLPSTEAGLVFDVTSYAHRIFGGNYLLDTATYGSFAGLINPLLNAAIYSSFAELPSPGLGLTVEDLEMIAKL